MPASCCGFERRNIAIGVLSLLLVIAVAGWVREVAYPNIQEPRMVRIIVSGKDIPTGTGFTKDNVDQLTEAGEVPESCVPPHAKLIQTKDELIGKRVTRHLSQGGWIYVSDLTARTQFGVESDKDTLTIPIPWRGDVTPGSVVDIIASITWKERCDVFTLLAGVKVLAVTPPSQVDANPVSLNVTMVSLAVNQKQALTIMLARQRNCQLELLLRHPDSQPREFDIDKSIDVLKSLGRMSGCP